MVWGILIINYCHVCISVCVCVCMCVCVCVSLKGTHTENILIFHGIAILTSETLQSKVFMILGFFMALFQYFCNICISC